MEFSFSLVIPISPATSLTLPFNGVRSEFVALKSLNFHSFFLQNFPNKRMAVFCSPKTKELKKGSFAFLFFVNAPARICCVCEFWLRCGTTFHLNELLIFLFVILNYSKFLISKYLSKRLWSYTCVYRRQKMKNHPQIANGGGGCAGNTPAPAYDGCRQAIKQTTYCVIGIWRIFIWCLVHHRLLRTDYF